MSRTATSNSITIRTDLQPGDIGSMIRQHGLLYAQEYGFDLTFEAYVAGPLAEFVCSRTPRDCLWIAEAGGILVGSVAIVGRSAEEAQLRWYLVDPSVRGQGLGTKLLREAVAFCHHHKYRKVYLWTVSALTGAARLYRSVGFEKVEDKSSRQWGVDVVEEKYVLALQ